MGAREEYQLVQPNKTSPTSHDLTEEVVMQACWSHGMAQCSYTTAEALPSHGRGVSPGMGLGAIALGSKRPGADRVVAGEQREQTTWPGATAATKKPALHQNPDAERRLRTQGF